MADNQGEEDPPQGGDDLGDDGDSVGTNGSQGGQGGGGQGGNPAAAAIALTDVEQVLTWIGFPTAAQMAAMMGELGDELVEIGSLKEKDISELADSYAKRTKAAGRMAFGLQRIKRLKALIHWVQDFERVDEEPHIDRLTQETFREGLKVAAERAAIRKEERDASETISRQATPGKLKDATHWDKWLPAIENMLSLIPGVMGVPLSYVIRKDETPEPGETYGTFTEECVAKAPLTGAAFEADSRQVHQLLMTLVQGEVAEQWTKPWKKAKDGRKDMQALAAHHEGEGNSSRRIADAERLKTNLHYKSERHIKFQVFLFKAQEMFNIFDLEGEPMSDDAKLRFLFERVQHPELKSAISALQVKVTMGDRLSFISAANHLAAQLSTTTDYRGSADRRVGISSVSGGTESPPEQGIMKGGKIYTGYYPDFYQMPRADRDAIFAERKKKGEPSTPGQSGHKQVGRGGNRSGKSRRVSATKAKAKDKSLTKEMLDFKSEMGGQVRKQVIAALKRERDDSSESEEEEEDPKDNAGTGFGGRAAKKSVKFQAGTKKGNGKGKKG
jgi:hypothetical protein